MHFEVLVEDKSGSIAVNIVLEKKEAAPVVLCLTR